jgi:preprotein translocase subunit Sec63
MVMNLEKARQLLALDIAATRREIREAYRREARRWHPDGAAPEKREECHQRMLEINEAYHFILAFLENYRYRLEEAPEAKDDYETWWDSHFGQSMGWPNQPRPRRPKKT